MAKPGTPQCKSFASGSTKVRYLLEAISDSTAFQIIDGQLYGYSISWENLDVVHAHLSGDVSQNGVAVLQLNLEHSVRQGLNNLTFELNYIVFSQRNPLPSKKFFHSKWK